MMIEKIDHINIVVSDLENARQFFTLFGFREIDSAELTGEWISTIVGLQGVRAQYVALSLPGGHTNIELIEYTSPKSECDPHISRANQIGFRHLAFAVDDIEEEVRRLTAAGIECLSPIKVFEKTGKKLVYFYGPDRILLELAEYPEA